MQNLTRVPRWDRALNAIVAKHLALPGVWGESDCFLTLADAVQAVTDTDIGAPWRGTYLTEAGAAKVLLGMDMRTVEDLLASLLPETGRLMARRGDAGTYERADGEVCCGFVTERGLAVKAERGLTFVPQTAMRKAFRVG